MLACWRTQAFVVLKPFLLQSGEFASYFTIFLLLKWSNTFWDQASNARLAVRWLTLQVELRSSWVTEYVKKVCVQVGNVVRGLVVKLLALRVELVNSWVTE